MRVYGLTGGIASGKSEVARRFAERGIPVVSADAIGHEVIEPGTAGEAAVVEAFGESILTDGCIDREKLGAVVFADAVARRKLNAILHPWIGNEIAQRCQALASDGHEVVIVEAALFAEEDRLEPMLDGLILVVCSRETRLDRLARLRGLTPFEAEGRIDSQAAPEKKLALADWVVENEGTLAELEQRVDDVIGRILAHGH